MTNSQFDETSAITATQQQQFTTLDQPADSSIEDAVRKSKKELASAAEKEALREFGDVYDELEAVKLKLYKVWAKLEAAKKECKELELKEAKRPHEKQEIIAPSTSPTSELHYL